MHTRILALVIAPLSLLGAERLTATLHNNYPMQTGSRLTVSNVNGSIEIAGWDQNTIDITAIKSAETQELLDQIKVDISAAADGLHISSILPESVHNGHLGVKYVIKAPRGIQLAEIRSTNGAIHVDGIDGPANLKTTNGSVDASKTRGKLEIQTSNGSVRVNEADGEAEVRTSNGAVHASALRGPLTATTSNGGIQVDLEDSRGGAVNLTTTNGGVNLKLGAVSQSPVKASTSNGGITVHMPRTAGVRVIAETSSNGRVSTDFDIRREGQNSQSRLEGVLGSGGPTMELKTSQGSIHLTE